MQRMNIMELAILGKDYTLEQALASITPTGTVIPFIVQYRVRAVCFIIQFGAIISIHYSNIYLSVHYSSSNTGPIIGLYNS